MLRVFLFLSTFVLCCTLATAQSLRHTQGELLVQFTAATQAEDWLANWNRLQPADLRLQLTEQVSRPTNIWLLNFDHNRVAEQAMLTAIRRSVDVNAAQFNHFVRLRAVPNDLEYDEQWQYDNNGQNNGTIDADIDAPEAWDETTGGLTTTGDTIVVAVLDNGIDRTHSDFQQNRWYNHAEIPGNGLDDDNNGYVDDYEGWNTNVNSDNIAGGPHGTAVAGIVGADGNNEIGVVGVNWNVKVMNIRNDFNTTEAKVLEAYSYPLEARLRYNSTGGAAGAFVVATNASWGVDEGDPNDFPIWCSFYNTLGAAGILNFGATANDDINVDLFGDMPTACEGDFLVTVTNTDRNDQKVISAGYGAASIDLGAPGAGAFTLTNNGNYAPFGGTSGATPHVTGAAALLYSLDCPALSALQTADPAAAALLIREAILEGVDPLSNLQGITATGGRLNLHNSVQYLLDRCEGCIPASSVQVTTLLVDAATITWNTNDSLQSVDFRYRAQGQGSWTTLTNVSTPLVLNNLEPCVEYEFQVQSNCAGSTIPFSSSRFFITDGCCTAPEPVTVSGLSDESASFSWQAITAAQAYEFRYRVQGTSSWEEINQTNTILVINELERCTFYEYQLRTICATETTDWTPITTFLTTGCGPCLDEEYCMPTQVLDAGGEHIAEVEVGGFFSNSSGSSGEEGYQDFGFAVDPFELEAGQTYPIQLTPGFSGGAFSQAWRVWIDFDHNGDFTTAEIVYTASATTEPVTGAITVPATANTGVTRMRVLMQFNTATSACPFLSGFGEIEDYCVDILPPQSCDAPTNLRLLNADFTTAQIGWDPVGGALDYEAAYRAADDFDWTPTPVTGTTVQLTQLDSCAEYLLRVRSFCNGLDGEEFAVFSFNTCELVDTDQPTTDWLQWQVMPNPTRSTTLLRFTDVHPDLVVRLLSPQGQVVWQHQLSSLKDELMLPLANRPAGVYWIQLIAPDGSYRMGQQVLKLD